MAITVGAPGHVLPPVETLLHTARRSEERGFAAPEKGQRKKERDVELDFDDWQRARRSGRGGGLN